MCYWGQRELVRLMASSKDEMLLEIHWATSSVMKLLGLPTATLMAALLSVKEMAEQSLEMWSVMSLARKSKATVRATEMVLMLLANCLVTDSARMKSVFSMATSTVLLLLVKRSVKH